MLHFWLKKAHNAFVRITAVATALNVDIGYPHETLAANRPSHSSVAIGGEVSRVCGINISAL